MKRRFVDNCPVGAIVIASKFFCVVILYAIASNALACPGDKRGFLSTMHNDGGRTVKAWMETRQRELLFFAVDVSRQGVITRVCSEPNPVSVQGLVDSSGSMNSITTWTWDLLMAKGHGKLLVGFWDTPEGTRLAESGEQGQLPPRCN